MPDYQEMYFKLFRATESAIDQLILAQQECEEMYLQAAQADIHIFPQVAQGTDSPLE